MDVQATFFATFVDELIRGGVTDAVISPGSRSALFAATIEANSDIRTHVMVDERSASFFALGLGLASGRPTLICTTSGTATAELHAAVVEAHQAYVPLLVCTADRPPELHHARDWQSIDQSRLYEGITRWHFDPGVAASDTSSYWRSIASRAVAETMHNSMGPGPVHLNLAVREPWSFQPGKQIEGRPTKAPWHTYHPSKAKPSEQVVESLSRAGKRGVIVAGKSDVDPQLVHQCAHALGWPVLADARSGCRIPASTTISTADALLRSDAFGQAHYPEVVLRFGSPVLSRVLPLWVAASGAEEWLIDPVGNWAGSIPDAAHIVQVDPTELFQSLEPCICCDVNGLPVRLHRSVGVARPHVGSGAGASANDWLESWQKAEVVAREIIARNVDEEALSEVGIACSLVAELPDDANLFLSTSMPVRDVEWYSQPRLGLHYYANRGASGMDGLISTAAGIAFATKRPTVMLVGDLSFLYDLNALWALRGVDGEINLTIVLMDNNGGGIFSMLPQLSALDNDVFERVVSTPQQVDIPRVIESFGINVTRVEKTVELMPAVQTSLSTKGLGVVYARTDRSAGSNLRKQIHTEIAQAMESV